MTRENDERLVKAMAKEETAAIEREQRMAVEPFAVEADAPRNRDIIVQAIPGCRMRGAVNANKPVIDQMSGQEMIPPDQAAGLGMLPPIPGQQLHVHPGKLSYVILDPLADDEELCDRIKSAIDRRGPFRTTDKLRGMPPVKGTLDVHRMKSLIRELIELHEKKCVKVIKGTLPTRAQCDALPGRYLMNPGSSIQNTQPRFEDEFESWVAGINKSGV